VEFETYLFLETFLNKAVYKPDMYKQAIIIRQDLNMPKGKLAAQAAHASVSAVLKSDKSTVSKWESEGMKKVVLKVENLSELKKLQSEARKNKLVNVMITDAGRTFFKAGTITCLAIGPDKEKEVDKVSGKLKLL